MGSEEGARGLRGGAMPMWSLSSVLLVLSVALVNADTELDEKIRQLHPEKFAKTHKKFKFFDEDGSATVSRAEFEKGLTALGYSPNDKKLDHIMNELDQNRDGVIVFKEFLRPTSNKYAEEKAIAESAYMDQAFEHMDENKDDKIDVDEFLKTMKTWPAFKNMDVTREQVDDFFKNYADIDLSGDLSFEELETAYIE